jgi:divalent metal cation (Fe/Co/Zn/Cd) transporter
MEARAAEIPLPPVAPDRARLVRRVRRLTWLGLAWHGVEAAVAIGAGLAAGSIALIGFGADSLIEALAASVLIWRFASARSGSHAAEHRAQRLISVTFYVLAAYIGIEAVRTFAGGDHPEVSYVGIGLSAFTLVTMPVLAGAKRRVGERLHSPATESEARQTSICAYLSAALLVGLGANALAGWWWADPSAALLIAAVAVREGRHAWRGESCCAAERLPEPV